MGNDDVSNPSYPAAYPDVVAVGAIDENEQRIKKSVYGWGSNTGPHIDVVAPGRNILSTVWNDSYAYYQGTSMAAPHVSGVAALMKSIKSYLTNTQITQILHETAKNLKDSASDPIPNNKYGFGLVNASAAVEKANSAPCTVAPYGVIVCPGPIQMQCPTPYYMQCPGPIQIQCPTPYIIQCPPAPVQVACPPAPSPIPFDPNVIINPVEIKPAKATTAKKTKAKKTK